MSPLWRKEFRSAQPFLALVIFFGSLNWLFLLLAEYPDQYPLSKLLHEDARTGSQLMMFVVAFAMAAGLLIREQDEGTLRFLDALPVGRARIFFCKFTVALFVLWLLPLVELLFNLSVHAVSRTSVGTGMAWNLLITPAFLDGAACVVYLSFGLALSFFRRFALFVLGLLVWVFVLLTEWQLPGLSLFNIFSLGDPVFAGQSWLIPWSKLGAQLGLAVFCTGVAFVAFHCAGDTAQRFTTRVTQGRVGAALAGLGTVAVIAVWLGLLGWFGARSETNEAQRVHYDSWSTARATTARYVFLYPENRAEAVRPLIERADDAEKRVRDFLQATPLGEIAVDLTGVLPRHAGLAHWKRVQMNLPNDPAKAGWDVLAAVLGHETTHVYIDHLSHGELNEKFNSIRFFHEGLASYVEYRLFFPPEKRAELRQVAAIVRARDQVRLEELLDNEQLRRKLDGDLVYPLGELFVAALVERYGEVAPGRVLRAFARDNAPKDLKGFALWQDTFQAAGFNLSDVTDGFFAELDRAVADYRMMIDSVPRLRGTVTQDEDKIIVQAVYEGELPGELTCRFRARADTEDRFFEMPSRRSGNTFRVDRADYPERSFWYQLGLNISGASQPVYEPWVEVRAAR